MAPNSLYDGTQTDPDTRVKIYIDGAYAGDVGSGTTIIDSAGNSDWSIIAGTASNPITIGCQPDTGVGATKTAYEFDGLIADVRIYEDILTSGEAGDLASGIDVQSSLVGWWITDVDDGTTTITDYAGTNDGTNSGSTYDAEGPNG